MKKLLIITMTILLLSSCATYNSKVNTNLTTSQAIGAMGVGVVGMLIGAKAGNALDGSDSNALGGEIGTQLGGIAGAALGFLVFSRWVGRYSSVE
ncbi:MAG: hypothetical protein KAH22_00780 [Thiotrichaceae bacterium]|nr:hypothetical protein [Thiotrichaceae bacterium]